MKEYRKNSKRTTDGEIQKLRESISLLGDISGIVFDVDSGEIICGNQRSAIMNINEREIITIKELKKPDKFGTLLYGYVEWEGQKYSFRKVRWNEEQRQLANISANLMYSSYDYFELGKNFTENVLKESGFDNHELKMIFGNEDFADTISKSFDDVNVKSMGVSVRFGDEFGFIDRERYKTWEENMLFEFDYNETAVESKILEIIQNGADSHR